MSGSAGGDDAVGARGGPPPGGPVRAGGRIVAALSRGADRVFGLTAAGTTPSREVVAGVTAFLAMAYFLFVNPQVLGETGLCRNAVFVATPLAAALGTLVMGGWARYPVALAPGLGLSAFFAFTVVLSLGIPWQTALAGTLVSGVRFFVLAGTGLRGAVINALPRQHKRATAAGNGLFVASCGR